MKTLSLAVLVVLVLAFAPAALAQRMPRGAERAEMIRKHLEQCEVCAGLQKQIDDVQAQLDELAAKREALELQRLEEKITELVEAYPDAKEPLEKLLELRKKLSEMATEMREAVDNGHKIMADLDLEPDDQQALAEAIGPIERLLPPGQRQRQFQFMRAAGGPGGGPGGGQGGGPAAGQGRNGGGNNNRNANRWAERRQEQRQQQLEELKESDPKMYEIEVEQDRLNEKLADLSSELRQTMFEHLRNAQQQNN